ncbi:MAG TPA: hypothetical protein VH166_13095 [Mycobacterium sp.]|jgi:hypothetical protein|nr:hypothetical protein [Mycobacterium sp.]
MRTGWGVAATLAAVTVVFAPAGLATAQPTQPGNAYATIGSLEDEGYNVIIDRIGNAPTNQCVVTSVRNPQTRTRTFWVGDGEQRRLITVVVSRSINVSLNCDV